MLLLFPVAFELYVGILPIDLHTFCVLTFLVLVKLELLLQDNLGRDYKIVSCRTLTYCSLWWKRIHWTPLHVHLELMLLKLVQKGIIHILLRFAGFGWEVVENQIILGHEFKETL